MTTIGEPYFNFGIYEFLDYKTEKYITVEIIEWCDTKEGVKIYKSGNSILACKDENDWKYRIITTLNNTSNERIVDEKLLLEQLAYTHATEEERNNWVEDIIPQRLNKLIEKKDLKPRVSGSRCPIC